MSRAESAPSSVSAPKTAPAPKPKPKPFARKLGWGLLGALLLLGPLLAVELGVRGQAQWLRPVLRKYTVSMDMKLLFIRERDSCPDFVTFGTSLTDQGLPPVYLRGKTLDGVEIRDPFDFGAAEVRATNILAQYRWLRRRGCSPRAIAVEVSPIVVNGEHGGPTHDPPLMSARAQLGMPPGFAALRGYTVAQQLELATYERLLIHRRRDKISERAQAQLEIEPWFVSEDEWTPKAQKQAENNRKRWAKQSERELERDGKMTGMRKSLTDASWRREDLKRQNYYRRGIYEYVTNETEKQALEILAREAAADGVIVIFQAPPVTSLYHAMEPKLGMDVDFEALSTRLATLADELDGVIWVDAHRDDAYQMADFADWVHLSKRGAKRYVKALVKASSAALVAESSARGGS